MDGRDGTAPAPPDPQAEKVLGLELGADDYRFDNTEERGKEMQITQESTIELESAEKWMRSVNTETRDFLRTRFDLEHSMRDRE